MRRLSGIPLLIMCAEETSFTQHRRPNIRGEITGIPAHTLPIRHLGNAPCAAAISVWSLKLPLKVDKFRFFPNGLELPVVLYIEHSAIALLFRLV